MGTTLMVGGLVALAFSAPSWSDVHVGGTLKLLAAICQYGLIIFSKAFYEHGINLELVVLC